MCGIVGLWDFKNKIRRELLEKMRDSLTHRGPDDEGVFIDQKNNLGLGHRRLSIIDLSPAGHQPMQTEDGRFVIVFNGEIYNFVEIKKELEQKGCKFFSNSDTEVVLKSFAEWGTNSVKKFRGMFALAIWDNRKEKLYLFRDRPGVKPLYYYWDNELFIFASELKAIAAHERVKREIDFNALNSYLQLGYIPAPLSVFKNIFKLEPGHFLILDKNRHLEKTPYWNIATFYFKQLPEVRPLAIEEAAEELEKILTESFKLRMVADVEVGHFLSGGLDSSLVAAILAKKLGFKNLKTFTIGFSDPKLNEAPFAKKIADYLGTEHYEKYCDEKEAMEIVPLLPEIYDEPFGDSSGIPTYLLAKFARQFVKVSLSADGGDETFCGYDRYWSVNEIFKKFKKIPGFILRPGLGLFNILPTEIIAKFYKTLGLFLPKQNITDKKVYKLKRKIAKLKEISRNPNDLLNFYLLLGFGFWKEPELSELLNNRGLTPVRLTWVRPLSELSGLDNLTQMQAFDYKTYLPDDILVKVDRATMANSLESRDPLLDHKIIEYMAGLPIDLKYRDGQGKYILRKILYKYLPQELVDRPKQGFTVPLEKWLRGDLKYLLDNYLDKNRLKKEGIFNPEIVESEKQKFLSQNIDYAEHLWLILMFEMWREKWYK